MVELWGIVQNWANCFQKMEKVVSLAALFGEDSKDELKENDTLLSGGVWRLQSRLGRT